MTTTDSGKRDDSELDVVGSRLSTAPQEDALNVPQLGVIGWARWFWRQLTSMRVALLLPVVVAISLVVRHRLRPDAGKGVPRLPGFLVGFVALVAAGSAGLLPPALVGPLNELSRACLVVAIAAVGLKTSPLELRKIALSAGVLLVAEALFLAGLVLVLQRLL